MHSAPRVVSAWRRIRTDQAKGVTSGVEKHTELVGARLLVGLGRSESQDLRLGKVVLDLLEGEMALIGMHFHPLTVLVAAEFT